MVQNLPGLPSDDMTALELLAIQKTFGGAVSQTVCCPKNHLHSACEEALAERSFSTLKLIETFLRSYLGQDHLTSLAIISINHWMHKQLS